MSNRAKWAALLPVITAFVEGKPIQRADYGGRWVDTDSMYSVLTGPSHRIRLDNFVEGEWSIEYEETQPGDVNGAIARGRLTWRGTGADTPRWPNRSGIKLLGRPVFLPSARGATT